MSDFRQAIGRGIFDHGHTGNCRCPKPKPAYEPCPPNVPVAEGTGASVFDLVSADLAVRNRVGMAEYGVPLRSFNGRDALRDAYEEALDLAVYLRQALDEREHQLASP